MNLAVEQHFGPSIPLIYLNRKYPMKERAETQILQGSIALPKLMDLCHCVQVGKLIWKQTNNSTDQKALPTYKQRQIIFTTHSSNYNNLLEWLKSVPEPFLSCCIPYLQFYIFTTNIYDLWTEFHSYSMIWVIFDYKQNKKRKWNLFEEYLQWIVFTRNDLGVQITNFLNHQIQCCS